MHTVTFASPCQKENYISDDSMVAKTCAFYHGDCLIMNNDLCPCMPLQCAKMPRIILAVQIIQHFIQ